MFFNKLKKRGLGHTGGKRDDSWSDQVIGMLNKKQRLDVDEVVKKQGFLGQ